MSIFNSLGSNYDFSLVFQALFSGNLSRHKKQLTTLLDEKYQGKSFLTYKGREAIKLALAVCEFDHDSYVAVNGFTCFAVWQAVTSAGYKVEYVDIDEHSLNFSAGQLRQAVNANPKILAVIAQNTLGYPCDIEEIASICQQKGLILIEDLAHCAGGKYKSGQFMGTVGDLVALSFSRDKIVDGVAGGALVVRDKLYHQSKVSFSQIPFFDQILDRFYPLFTLIIRSTYDWGIGKLTHSFLKRLNLLSKTIDDGRIGDAHDLPSWQAFLILRQFEILEKDLGHRREVALIYAQNLNPKLLWTNIVEGIDQSTNIRFPIFVPQRRKLIAFLKTKGFHLSDVWYDAPVAPAKFLPLTDYTDQCPNAQKICQTIVNLPTHRNITQDQARRLTFLINQFYQNL